VAARTELRCIYGWQLFTKRWLEDVLKGMGRCRGAQRARAITFCSRKTVRSLGAKLTGRGQLCRAEYERRGLTLASTTEKRVAGSS